MRRGARSKRDAGDDDAFAYSLDKSNFRPGVAYDVDVSRGSKRRPAECGGEEASVASDGSEQMIIKRDTRVDVQVEPRSVLDGPSGQRTN